MKEHEFSRIVRKAVDMKTCPVCKARCFDDMEICFGCMHRFDGGETSANRMMANRATQVIGETAPVDIEPEIPRQSSLRMDASRDGDEDSRAFRQVPEEVRGTTSKHPPVQDQGAMVAVRRREALEREIPLLVTGNQPSGEREGAWPMISIGGGYRVVISVEPVVQAANLANAKHAAGPIALGAQTACEA